MKTNMKTNMETDEKVMKLMEVVAQKKKEIGNLERPKWKTNCSFRWTRDAASSTNIQVLKNVDELVEIWALLDEKEKYVMQARESLGLPKKSVEWQASTVEDWKSDIKTRIDQINITEKKNQLAALEKKLSGLVSEDKRRELELAEIEKELM